MHSGKIVKQKEEIVSAEKINCIDNFVAQYKK